MDFENLSNILDSLPDPAFVLSSTGRYVALFGGQDSRYYHDGQSLVGQYISDVIKPDKANWFLRTINRALANGEMLVEEYELSGKDIIGLPEAGPRDPIRFEGRIQALKFKVDDEPVVLWVATNISDRHKLEVELRHLSDTDQLTGLSNRRRLERELSTHFKNYQRYKTPTSLLMLDLDNLKEINDSQGHRTGDDMLMAMADVCRAELRDTDIACRFGGDEFIIVLPNTQPEEASVFAERLHKAFHERSEKFSKNNIVAGVSVGVTAFSRDDTSYEDAIHRADSFLYQAKNTGKNNVVIG